MPKSLWCPRCDEPITLLNLVAGSAVQFPGFGCFHRDCALEEFGPQAMEDGFSPEKPA